MREILAHYPIPWLWMLGVLGALFGSFLNVVIVRLPRGQSIIHPPSHCPKCGYRIPPWLNVPVLSWLVLRGRCRKCQAPISIRYPVVELLTALLFVAVGQRFGISTATLAGLIFVCGLLVVTFIDIDWWEIPDEISIGGMVVGCILRPLAFDVPWYSGLAGVALGAGVLMTIRVVWLVVRKIEAMGLGDVKLLGMIGAFLGPWSIIFVLLVASVLGATYGITVLFIQRIRGVDEAVHHAAPEFAVSSIEPDDASASDASDEEEWVPPKTALPFGPFLAIGGITVLLFAPAIQRALLEVDRLIVDLLY